MNDAYTFIFIHQHNSNFRHVTFKLTILYTTCKLNMNSTQN
jgi:hypothetical protein